MSRHFCYEPDMEAVMDDRSIRQWEGDGRKELLGRPFMQIPQTFHERRIEHFTRSGRYGPLLASSVFEHHAQEIFSVRLISRKHMPFLDCVLCYIIRSDVEYHRHEDQKEFMFANVMKGQWN
jgi:hypothetical protein